MHRDIGCCTFLYYTDVGLFSSVAPRLHRKAQQTLSALFWFSICSRSLIRRTKDLIDFVRKLLRHQGRTRNYHTYTRTLPHLGAVHAELRHPLRINGNSLTKFRSGNFRFKRFACVIVFWKLLKKARQTYTSTSLKFKKKNRKSSKSFQCLILV